MSISLSSALSIANAPTAANPSPNATQTTESPQPQSSSSTGYTVQLSEAQQVFQLYNQGQQVSQIASTLNLSVASVNNYLGISSSNT